MNEQTNSPVHIEIQPTPNPNALKFILDRPVKTEGNSTYRTPMDCGENHFAATLFTIRGVDQVHFFDNVITITKFNYEPWDQLELAIINCIEAQVPQHNPNYYDPDPELERRQNLSPELKSIESILDRTIRPGLQADGGDIQTVSYQDSVLLVRYQGACGTCPSSTAGTLEAIKNILRHEFNPDLDVYIAPEV